MEHRQARELALLSTIDSFNVDRDDENEERGRFAMRNHHQPAAEPQPNCVDAVKVAEIADDLLASLDLN